VGGSFDSVNGLPRNSIARLAVADGKVDGTWMAKEDEGFPGPKMEFLHRFPTEIVVQAIGITERNEVLVGGNFQTVCESYDGSRSCLNDLAKIDPQGRFDKAWMRNRGGSPGSVSILSIDGDQLYAGGNFGGTAVAGEYYLAATVPIATMNHNQRGITGTWYNPRTSGQGFTFQVYPDMKEPGKGLLAGAWYTFEPANALGTVPTKAGGQRWYYLDGDVDPRFPYINVTIYAGTGGRFDAPPKIPASVVGGGTLSLLDCNRGYLSYVLDDGNFLGPKRYGYIPLTRITANVSCAPAGDNGAEASNNLLSGLWYRPDTGGQGLVLDVNPINQFLFAGWYTYAHDGSGEQRWYTLQAPLTPGAKTVQMPILTATGGVFDAEHPVVSETVGSAQVVFESCTSMTVTYTFNDGTKGSMKLQPTGPVPAGCKL
jgi:hypothetical protein